MFEFVSEHQFWAAVAIYWIFSAAVSSIIKASPWRARASRPDPRTVGSSGYLWLYRFLHSIAGNVTTAFAGKIPGLKTFLLVVMIPGLLAVSGCVARYTVHPGGLDKRDSAAYDVLLIAQSTIDQARILYQNLQLIFEIAKLALSVVDTHLEGKDQDFSVETRLVQIIRTGVQAYHQHTGEPLDPALIKVEEPL